LYANLYRTLNVLFILMQNIGIETFKTGSNYDILQLFVVLSILNVTDFSVSLIVNIPYKRPQFQGIHGALLDKLSP